MNMDKTFLNISNLNDLAILCNTIYYQVLISQNKKAQIYNTKKSSKFCE